MSLLSDDLCRIVKLSSEKGASSWLLALPIEEHGFALHRVLIGMHCVYGIVDYQVAFLLSVSVTLWPWLYC